MDFSDWLGCSLFGFNFLTCHLENHKINRPRRKRTGYGKRFAPECQIRIAIPKLRRRAAGNTSPTRFNWWQNLLGKVAVVIFALFLIVIAAYRNEPMDFSWAVSSMRFVQMLRYFPIQVYDMTICKTIVHIAPVFTIVDQPHRSQNTELVGYG